MSYLIHQWQEIKSKGNLINRPARILINIGESTGLPTGCGIQRLSQFYLNFTRQHDNCVSFVESSIIGAERRTWVRKDRQRKMKRSSQWSKKDKKREEIMTTEKTKSREISEDGEVSRIHHKSPSMEC